MTVYQPTKQDWHFALPGSCSCEPPWRERGMVDDKCEWHRLIDAVEWLREEGWTTEPPRLVTIAAEPWGPDHPSYDEMGQ